MNEIGRMEKSEIKRDESELVKKFKELSKDESSSVSSISDADDLITARIEKRSDSVFNETNENLENGLFEKIIEKSLKPCNPNYENGKKWRINCQRCVPTYELRRRGYDVTAQPKEKAGDELSAKPFSVWDNPDIIECKKDAKKEIEEKMDDWGDGARAQITVEWRNTNKGHTFMAERHNGKTYYYDPQTANSDVSSYFKRVDSNCVKFCRIDNLSFSDKIYKCCREV